MPSNTFLLRKPSASYLKVAFLRWYWISVVGSVVGSVEASGESSGFSEVGSVVSSESSGVIGTSTATSFSKLVSCLPNQVSIFPK